MNCRRFQRLLFEYAEGSLSPTTITAAERHLTNCSACREIAQQHRRFARSLSERFHRHTEPIAFAQEEQRRLIAILQEPSSNVVGGHVSWGWRRHLAWIGASAAALVMGLLLITGFPFRSPVRVALPVQIDRGTSHTPVLIRSSYCAPIYIFWQEGDWVVDSLSCNPRVVEQTLWLAQNQKPASTKPGTNSPL